MEKLNYSLGLLSDNVILVVGGLLIAIVLFAIEQCSAKYHMIHS